MVCNKLRGQKCKGQEIVAENSIWVVTYQARALVMAEDVVLRQSIIDKRMH